MNNTMAWPNWEVFEVKPDKPHRRAFASCKNIRNEMVECLRDSPCFKAGTKFEDCLCSQDITWVTEKCADLRRGYSKCKKNLLNPMRRLRPSLYD